MSNPFFKLQERVAELLRARAYFAALSSDAILTEKVGDLDAKVQNELLSLGFGVVITTAKGDCTGSLTALASKELIGVTFIHNPTTEGGYNVLDALAEAITAIQGKPLWPTTVVRKETDAWSVNGHERITDAPKNLHVHQLIVQATVMLS